MATYRQVHTNFWQDSFILELTPEEKYFYIYLLTNSKTSQCGIYELPKKVMEIETGYNRETIDKLLQRFIDYGKIRYDEMTKEVFIVNWIKYNKIDSPKVKTCIVKELQQVKNKQFIKDFITLCKQYGYSIDTLFIDYGEEEEKEEEKEKEYNNISSKEDSINDKSFIQAPYEEIKNLFNSICVTLPKIKNIKGNRQKVVRQRWKENPDINFFKELFERVNNSDFLSGRSGKWFGCSFDWIMQPSNLQKIIEGNYDNNRKIDDEWRDFDVNFKDF